MWVRIPPRVLALAALAALLVAATARADTRTVTSGPLQAQVTLDPFRITFVQPGGRVAFAGEPAGSDGAPGFRDTGLTAHATAARDVTSGADGTLRATLATDDPLGRTLGLTVTPRADGIIRVTLGAPADADLVSIGFGATPDERFLGFGERSDQVVRTDGDVQDLVTEGPFQDAESPFVAAFVPLPGYNTRHDATYFPIPWLLSSRGAGFLVRDDARSMFHLGRPWRVEVEGDDLTFDVYAGTSPAEALQRFSADVGRQPPAAAPFYFGPWWQPANGDADLTTLERAGAAGSLAMTYTHYLPCGAQQGGEAGQRARTAKYHAAGLAITTYFNPMICTTYHPRYDQAAARGLLTRDGSGRPYVYRYTGSTTFLVGQFDFSQPAARRFYGDLLDEAVQQGYDGWMEDFGEYTPFDARAADGATGTGAHDRYVVQYHQAAREYARDRAPRPLARFNRSGWTGAAAQSQLVWGGDPSTTFGFDGLQSAVRDGLSIGLSGVSLWGSDIGGYFALSLPQTTPDLLRRWIEVGFASGVMRTEADGFSIAPSTRSQIVDKDVLPVWARYAKLRTQLYPYLAAAEREYDRTGMPIMRQLALAYPGDARAATRDDEYLFGPDLLVAPVLTAATTTRRLYLPPGRWIDWWRSVTLDPAGAPVLGAPRILEGGRDVDVPAPVDELPIFVRAGAALTLLPADVRTLSDYGAGHTVRLADRQGTRKLIAWPDRARHGRWTVRIADERVRRVSLQIAVPVRPRCVTAGGRRLRFHWRDGVLRTRVRARVTTVSARLRCG